MDCNQSFLITLPECPEQIRLLAGLTNNHSYTWVIEDKHGNEYSEVTTTDANGILTINANLMPDGLFNYAAGAFSLQIYSNYPYYQLPLNLTFCGEVYDSVLFDFRKRSSTQNIAIAYIECTP